MVQLIVSDGGDLSSRVRDFLSLEDGDKCAFVNLSDEWKVKMDMPKTADAVREAIAGVKSGALEKLNSRELSFSSAPLLTPAIASLTASAVLGMSIFTFHSSERLTKAHLSPSSKERKSRTRDDRSPPS